MELERSAGILLHISALPSAYGIGDFGPDAFKFVDFLSETKQKLWQILPITMTNTPSPYSSLSAFGGHIWLISPEKLFEAKLLSKDDLKSIDQSKFHDQYVYFRAVQTFKERCLEIAFENFRKSNSQGKEILNEFAEKEKYWIDDLSLFLTIEEKYKDKKWSEWPEPLRRRDPSALQSVREIDKDRIEYHIFVQYIFDQQWTELKNYAHQSNIKIIGDMPIYPDYHSVDVWAHSHLFQLDHQDTMKPTVVAGFPPDHSSTNVQIWNMPVYDWNNESVKPKIFHWWIERLRKILSVVDVLRVDHFRGLESHYVIPMDVKTDKPKTSEARWVKTPGYELFTAVTHALGEDIPLVTEDLGDVTDEVFALRDHFKFHGMKILQMGFYFDPDNMYCPHHYPQHSVAYTGTHDNPSTLDWWKTKSSSKERTQFLEYISRPIESEKESINGYSLNKHVDQHICWYFIQLLFQSAANGAIIQMQDLLEVELRFNEPGIGADTDHDGPQNWSWRFQWSELTKDIRNRLKRLTQLYGRDLEHGKAIPPKDMIMKDDSKCLLQ